MKITKILKIVGICALSVVILLTLYILCLMGGSDYTTYPHDKASVWECNDPHIVYYCWDNSGRSYLEWNGEKIPICTIMKSNILMVYLRRPEDSVNYQEEDLLFYGIWRYKGNNMVVKIESDYIFNGAYTELVFAPQ